MQPFDHNRRGPKIRGLRPFLGRGLGPHLTQSRLGWGLPPCQVPVSSIQSFGHNKHGPKTGGWGGGTGSPSNTKSPCTEADLHTKWHLDSCSHMSATDMGRKLGCAPLGKGELGPHLTQCGQGRLAEDYLYTKWHPDPLSHLATIHRPEIGGCCAPF